MLSDVGEKPSVILYWCAVHTHTHTHTGVTRERLESFDRPVKGEPQWFDGKKDALIRDFRHYLGILKSVHSGADLQASAAAAGSRCGFEGKEGGGYCAFVCFCVSRCG